MGRVWAAGDLLADDAGSREEHTHALIRGAMRRIASARKSASGGAIVGAREGHIASLRGLIGTRLLIVPSVSVCLRNHDRILLAHHPATGVWSTPGGAIEPGETVSDACRREAREELLIDVEPVAIAAVLGPDEVVYPNGDRTAYVTTVFACHADGAPSYDGDEIDEIRWVSADEATSMPVAPWLRAWVEPLTRWRLGDPAIYA